MKEEKEETKIIIELFITGFWLGWILATLYWNLFR